MPGERRSRDAIRAAKLTEGNVELRSYKTGSRPRADAESSL